MIPPDRAVALEAALRFWERARFGDATRRTLVDAEFRLGELVRGLPHDPPPPATDPA